MSPDPGWALIEVISLPCLLWFLIGLFKHNEDKSIITRWTLGILGAYFLYYALDIYSFILGIFLVILAIRLKPLEEIAPNPAAQNQVTFDLQLVRDYGLEEAIVIGILFDPDYMAHVANQEFGANSRGVWDIVREEKRSWIGLGEAEFQLLFPFWEVQYVQSLFKLLEAKQILEKMEGRMTFYTLHKGIYENVLKRFAEPGASLNTS